MATRSSRVVHKLKEIYKVDEQNTFFVNRNPRNLEKLRIAYKPSGYHLENPGRSFWHKLELNATGRHVTAQIVHFQSGPVLQASTSEWAIKKQLYKTTDTAAYINLAKVFAQRCHETGLTEIMSNIKATPNGKIDKFIKTLEAEGIALSEGEQFKPHRPWDQHRPEKPWEVTE